MPAPRKAIGARCFCRDEPELQSKTGGKEDIQDKMSFCMFPSNKVGQIAGHWHVTRWL
jgi:hypothetical protein